jgi:hypothetical protein
MCLVRSCKCAYPRVQGHPDDNVCEILVTAQLHNLGFLGMQNYYSAFGSLVMNSPCLHAECHVNNRHVFGAESGEIPNTEWKCHHCACRCVGSLLWHDRQIRRLACMREHRIPAVRWQPRQQLPHRRSAPLRSASEDNFIQACSKKPCWCDIRRTFI